ncbi:MAG: hypothetical protein IID46_10770, partial [Planctomycetes bacterium]|nr:hypothetical protein [Planctomycetota bacterium]
MFSNVSKNRGFYVRQGQRLTASEPAQKNSHSTDRRRGVILVLSAVFMVVILSFTALTIDLAYISLTKTQLQAAADGAALGAGLEMGYGFGENAETASTVLKKGTAAAEAVAAVHKNGDLDSTYLDGSRGIRFGTLTWDEVSESWQETWGASPYNLVQVRINRGRSFSSDALSNSAGDGPLPLLFGPIVGKSTMSVT